MSKIRKMAIFMPFVLSAYFTVHASDNYKYKEMTTDIIKTARTMGDQTYACNRDSQMAFLKSIASAISSEDTKLNAGLTHIAIRHAYRKADAPDHKSFFYTKKSMSLNEGEKNQLKKMLVDVSSNANDYLLTGHGTLHLFANVNPQSYQALQQDSYIGAYGSKPPERTNTVEAVFDIKDTLENLSKTIHTRNVSNAASMKTEKAGFLNDVLAEEAKGTGKFFKMYPGNPQHAQGTPDVPH